MRPRWANTEYDPSEPPDVASEIIGRGQSQRKSKTYLDNMELSTILGFIRGHVERLSEAFRRSHERHYSERLDDDELREKYPVIEEWEQMHQEQVDHLASLKGFSVRAASGLEEEKKKRWWESSAGADNRAAKAGGGSGGEERWR